MIYLLGDVHGRFDHILPAIEADRETAGGPRTAIFLGDIEAQRPFEEEIRPLTDAGIDVWFIPGNHDTDARQTWERLLPSWHRNLHGRVVTIEGLRVAGLGGIFRGEIWYPAQFPNKEAGGSPVPVHRSFDEYERHIRPTSMKRRLSITDVAQLQAVPDGRGGAGLHDHSLQGKLLKHSSTIFSDTYDSMMDVLVTHEAPSCPLSGFLFGPQTSDDIGCLLHFAGFNVLIAQREDLQKGEDFLSLLEARHILKHGLGLAILGDDERFAVFGEFRQHFRSICHEVADGFDLGRVAHGGSFGSNKD